MKLVHEEFKTYRDGLRINGSMFRPQGNGPFPIVVVSHEFMMNRITTVAYTVMLAKMGYAAFCYDFNGGGSISQSEGKTTDMSVLTEKKDLYAVIDYAKKQPYTDENHLTLWGCSQGGMVSSLVAAELGKDVVEKLVLFYPALSIPDDARKGSMILAKFDPQNVPKTLFCGPIILGTQYVTDVLEMDPYSLLDKYHGPVLILHGNADHIVDHSYSVKAYEAYCKSNQAALEAGEIDELPQVDFKTIEKAGHMFMRPTSKIDALNTVKEFLQGRTEILELDVRLTGLGLIFENGKLNLHLPFKGNADGKYIRGSVQPNASDERYYELGKPSDICADYVISGKDPENEDVSVHVQNRNVKGGWKPTVSSIGDSLAFLNKTEAFARLRQRGVKGPLVRIFADYKATKE